MIDTKWSYSPQQGTKNHCSAAQVWDKNGHSLAVIESTEDEKDATNTAKVMSVAPELLESLQELIKVYNETGQLYYCDINDAKAVIEKATK